MLGLPKSTELSKQLPKKIIYEKFNMNTSEKDKFDADIKKITIINEISVNTTTLEKGKEISGFFVLLISLKKKNYDIKIIEKISKLINQNILFLLEFEGQGQLVACYPKIIKRDWEDIQSIIVTLNGLNLDQVWEDIIIQIGKIQVEDGKTLEEQIMIQEQIDKLRKKIIELEKKIKSEKQPKRKFEMFQEIKKIEKEIEEK